MAIQRQASRSAGAAFGRTLAIGLLVLAAAGLVLARLDWIGDRFRGAFGTERVDRTEPAILQAIEDLAEYHAATGVFEVVVDLEHDTKLLPSFVAGQRTLFVAHGSVDGIVDFDRLGPDAVRVDADRRRVEITLPLPRLAAPALDLARSRVFERRRGIADRIGEALSNSPTDDRELHTLAIERLGAAAAASDVRARARANTEQLLRSLLATLGYTEVVIVWVDPCAPSGSAAPTPTGCPA